MCSNLPSQIAVKSIHQSKWIWLPGLALAARLVGERPQEWFGRVSGADDRQRWVRAADLRPGSGTQSHDSSMSFVPGRRALFAIWQRP
jgi:hypothetical protein